jgi:outer membrane protein OmpA-like peptidoglycan-associated protein
MEETMTFRRACALGLALGAASWTTALAETPFGVGQVTGPDGVYVGVEGGWSHMNGQSPDDPLTYQGTTDEGYIVGGKVGYKTGQLRLELGFDFSQQNMSTLSITNDAGLGHRLGVGSLNGLSGAASGSVQNEAFMANAIWDLRTDTRWVPYIGMGVGGANLSLNGVGVGGVPISNSSDFVFAYQPMVGVRYMVSDRIQVGLEYRYFATVDPTFKDSSGQPYKDKYETHNVLLSLLYHFGSPPAPEPVAAAAPAPAPVPVAPAEPAAPAPAAKQQFIVFFDFDRATLTDEGKHIVEAAANAFKQDPNSQIQLTGYTDLSGTQRYNLELSRRRAETVRDYMVHLGVPQDSIGVAWKGKENPRVPTPDGVREPQNRRVEIVIP